MNRQGQRGSQRANPKPRQCFASLRSVRGGHAGRVAILALASGLLAACDADSVARPDLVLITTAHFPPESIACHGGDENSGRELCAVGTRGTRYVWAFGASDAPAPAVASILSGLPPEVHGVGPSAADFLRQGVVTVSERLAEVGYETAAFVSSPDLNRSRGFDQGFATFDDRFDVLPSDRDGERNADPAERAAQWVTHARSPWFAWVHLGDEAVDPASPSTRLTRSERVRRLDRSFSRLQAVLDTRSPTAGLMLTSLPAQVSAGDLTPARTRVALFWRPPRLGGGAGIARVIRTPVGQIDIASTLFGAAGLDVQRSAEGGLGVSWPLPYRERRADDPKRVIVIEGTGRRARVEDGVYLTLDVWGSTVGRAPIPLTGERSPRLRAVPKAGSGEPEKRTPIESANR